jgi:hypothetical protein
VHSGDVKDAVNRKFMELGILAGLLIGAGAGMATGHLVAWLAIGIPLGILMGFAWSTSARRRNLPRRAGLVGRPGIKQNLPTPVRSLPPNS